MSEISIEDFSKIKKTSQIIDIREAYEYDMGNIPNSYHIPMNDILHSIDKIDNTKSLIIYCQSGRRAAAVVYMLKRNYGIKNVYNLKGGFSEYKSQI